MLKTGQVVELEVAKKVKSKKSTRALLAKKFFYNLGCLLSWLGGPLVTTKPGCVPLK
jgi:hypothetical protein